MDPKASVLYPLQTSAPMNCARPVDHISVIYRPEEPLTLFRHFRLAGFKSPRYLCWLHPWSGLDNVFLKVRTHFNVYSIFRVKM